MVIFSRYEVDTVKDKRTVLIIINYNGIDYVGIYWVPGATVDDDSQRVVDMARELGYFQRAQEQFLEVVDLGKPIH
jgi:hypothetical protein